MGNDKYINYYIETLTATMTDCVIRNVSMQANAKITDEVVKEQIEKVDVLTKSNDELKQVIEELKQNINKADNETIQNLKVKVAESELNVSNLTNQLTELNNKYRDYDSVRNQATHVDTFKSELIKAREETNKTRGELEIKINSLISENNGKIEALNGQHEKNISLLIQKHETEKSVFNSKVEELVSKIEYLQLPPAKRKKIDELNKEATPTVLTDLVGVDGVIKDGGTF
jgi:chromosome segregation ATPase